MDTMNFVHFPFKFSAGSNASLGRKIILTGLHGDNEILRV